ncbi:MAG: tRNA (N6-threonylcarbamoyladenosine(37)-N6)-methyltransferase TrmO [Rhizobiales bacterium 65-9]|nr:tRNA (N6-threonylcarbamoyladenosine(37)-N6)-methyltransferase TrmO [Hyphomicrobiales bacterium]OJY32922.1 MAG: tRNA (N6-threonylcarbamoyladenosine(37)-N6)-methyltransferase TrmO [Rhizobiales bacterium 65-9]
MEPDPREPRPGEIRIDLPAPTDAAIRFIGRIRTPWRERSHCPKNSREAIARGDQALASVEIDPRFADGLRGVEGFSHLWILYWMDRGARDLIMQAPAHLAEPRGVFALRSPARPNPIAMAAARLIEVKATSLLVLGVDCLDGTPLVDVKPYFASTDAIADAVRP